MLQGRMLSTIMSLLELFATQGQLTQVIISAISKQVKTNGYSLMTHLCHGLIPLTLSLNALEGTSLQQLLMMNFTKTRRSHQRVHTCCYTKSKVKIKLKWC